MKNIIEYKINKLFFVVWDKNFIDKRGGNFIFVKKKNKKKNYYTDYSTEKYWKTHIFGVFIFKCFIVYFNECSKFLFRDYVTITIGEISKCANVTNLYAF